MNSTHEDTALKIDGNTFLADSPLVPLLKELNRCGLRTLYHYAGHGDNSPHNRDAYIVLDADCLLDISITNDQYGRRLILRFPQVVGVV